jgi:hydroxybutyrate-dimer hydrolase
MRAIPAPKTWRNPLLAAAAFLAAGSVAAAADRGRPPPHFIAGPVDVRHYGAADDLLTAGLGWSGIASPVAPAVSDPPTREELRRLAIYTNMRALISVSPTEGFGTIYGTLGLVPGTEYLAFGKDGRRSHGGSAEAAFLVQIPEDFDREEPCIVTAPSSGSRGVYGAISNAEAAFRENCAVAYTDKGTGVGFHDLTRDVVYDLFGRARPSDEVRLAHFRVPDTPAVRSFTARFPHRIAIKHAHSRENPERDWGRFVLQSIEFALWAVNDRFDRRWSPRDVRIVAAGVSNGGGAALLAAEQDFRGLIDGVVVSEPQIQPRRKFFAILDRGRFVPSHSRSLYDVTTFMNVYADCAGVDTNAITPTHPGVMRCAALKARGLLDGATPLDQILEARERIHRAGMLPDADRLLPSHASLHLWRILAPVYGNAYARASIADHLCFMSFASTGADGTVVPWDEANLEKAFATSGGLPGAALSPPGGGPFIVDDAKNPPQNELLSPDLNLDGALCWRSLATGRFTPTWRIPPASARRAAEDGIADVRAEGDLHGTPALILHGRKDALIAPNHSSRAYFGLNRVVEGRRSRLRYIEVANGNHFDALIPLYPILGAPGETLVAMHGYFNGAVETMLRHLDGDAALPASQVFAATEETCPLPTAPAATDRVRFERRTVIIPAGGTPAGC